MQHSSDLLEIIASDLNGGTYDANLIRNAIAGLEKVLYLMDREELA